MSKDITVLEEISEQELIYAGGGNIPPLVWVRMSLTPDLGVTHKLKK